MDPARLPDNIPEAFLLDLFVRSARQTLDRLCEAMQRLAVHPGEPGAREIVRLCHNLKGSSRQMGFDDLGSMAAEMEALAWRLDPVAGTGGGMAAGTTADTAAGTAAGTAADTTPGTAGTGAGANAPSWMRELEQAAEQFRTCLDALVTGGPMPDLTAITEHLREVQP